MVDIFLISHNQLTINWSVETLYLDDGDSTTKEGKPLRPCKENVNTRIHVKCTILINYSYIFNWIDRTLP